MCDPTLITLLKMQPHYSQSSRENATPSSGTSPLASYKEVPPPRAKVPFTVSRITECPGATVLFYTKAILLASLRAVDNVLLQSSLL